MVKSFTADQMREIDRKSIEEYKIPGLILMENAGRGAADLVCSLIIRGHDPDFLFTGRKSGHVPIVGIFAGKGNNGGDAFVVARHLHNRGIPFDVHFLGRVTDVNAEGDAGTNLNILVKMGIKINELMEESEIVSLDLSKYGLLVDGLLGTGLSGNVRGNYRTLIEKFNASGVDCLAIDIPSGLSADDGTPLGIAVKAKATATFGGAKRGFDNPAAATYIGDLTVIEISIPRELLEG